MTDMAPNQEQERADTKIPGDPPWKKKNKISAMYKSKPKSNKNLKLFIENLEKDLINPKDVKKFRLNITREEQVALKEVKNLDKQTIKTQDKESRFVILDSSDYEEKVQHK